MKNASILISALFAAICPLSGFSETSAAESTPAELVEKYADMCCRFYNYCGPLVLHGSGLYGEQCNERLRTTPDQELKRLVALTYLSAEIESALDALEKGVVQEGKSTRKMKRAERGPSEAHVREMLHDLAVMDPSDSKNVVAELTARLDAAVKGSK